MKKWARKPIPAGPFHVELDGGILVNWAAELTAVGNG